MNANLISIVVDGTVRAVALIANEQRISFNEERMADTLKKVIDAGLDELKDHLQKALEVRMGEAMYRGILNVGCNFLAMRALQYNGNLPKPNDDKYAEFVKKIEKVECKVCNRFNVQHNESPICKKCSDGGDREHYT